MFDRKDDQGGWLSEEAGFDLLRDLERNKTDDVRRARAHERLAIKSKLIVQPGNASELLAFKVQGTTGDVSPGGCQALLPVPLGVGDVYRLSFDRAVLDIPMAFARCIRCRLIRENAYESGFTFFTPVDLRAGLRAAS